MFAPFVDAGVISVFDAQGKQTLGTRCVIPIDKGGGLLASPLREFTPGDPTLEVSKDDALVNFYDVQGLSRLRPDMWELVEGVVIGGGSVAAALLGLDRDEASDIDFFFVGEVEVRPLVGMYGPGRVHDSGFTRALKILKAFTGTLERDEYETLQISLVGSVLTAKARVRHGKTKVWTTMRLQFILPMFPSVRHISNHFDLASCCVFLGKGTVFSTTTRGMEAYQARVNIVSIDTVKSSPNTLACRIIKYHRRGFGMWYQSTFVTREGGSFGEDEIKWDKQGDDAYTGGGIVFTNLPMEGLESMAIHGRPPSSKEAFKERVWNEKERISWACFLTNGSLESAFQENRRVELNRVRTMRSEMENLHEKMQKNVV